MAGAVIALGSVVAGGAAATAAGFAAGTLGYIAVSAATSMVVSSVAISALGLNKPASSAADQAQRGITLNTAGTTDAIPVIYGKRRIGGTRCLVATSGGSNEYLHLVVAHCEGEVEEISAIYLDNELIQGDRFAGVWSANTHTGSDSQAADSALIAAIPDEWTSTDKLSGIAYTALTLTYDTTAFSGLPVISVEIRGRKCYDPRDSVTRYTDNPALILRDYLTNTRYGRGIPVGMIDDSSIIAAANTCAELVSTPDGTEPRYTCNLVVDTDASSLDNIRAVLATCRGMLVFTGGLYRLRLDQAQTPVFTFSEDNIIGGWRIQLADKRHRYNRVRAEWIDPESDWQAAICVADSADFRANDNNLMLEDRIALHGVTMPYQAQILAQRHLRQSRYTTTVQFTSTIAGMLCEVGDVVSITHGTPGWDEKPFRIFAISLLDSDEVQITATEYDDAVYADDPLTAVSAAPATTLPNPYAVAAPTGLTFTQSRTVPDRAVVSWIAVPDIFVREYQIEYKKDTDSSWVILPRVSGTQTAIDNLPPPATGETGIYNVRVFAENTLGIRSAYASTTGHISVVAIPNISGLELFNQGPNDTDFVGRDAVFLWRRSSALLAAEIGSEAYGADSGAPDYFFKDFEIRVYISSTDPATGWALARTVYATDSRYTYPWEQNAEDYRRLFGAGASRNVRIEVKQRGKYNQRSQIAARLTVRNPEPESVSAIITPRYNGFVLSYSQTAGTDYTGIKIFVARPGVHDYMEIYSGPEISVNIRTLLPDTDYNIKWALMDAYGDGAISSPESITTTVATISGNTVTTADMALDSSSIAINREIEIPGTGYSLAFDADAYVIYTGGIRATASAEAFVLGYDSKTTIAGTVTGYSATYNPSTEEIERRISGTGLNTLASGDWVLINDASNHRQVAASVQSVESASSVRIGILLGISGGSGTFAGSAVVTVLQSASYEYRAVELSRITIFDEQAEAPGRALLSMRLDVTRIDDEDIGQKAFIRPLILVSGFSEISDAYPDTYIDATVTKYLLA